MAYKETYSAEARAQEAFKDFLEENWDERLNNEVPKPQFVAPNEEIKMNLKMGDVCAVRVETPGLQDTQRGNWTYKDVKIPVLITIYTMKSRQRLWDLKQEITRICYHFKHDMDEFQLVRMVSFMESTDDTARVWEGDIRVSLESNGVYVECTGGA